MILNFMNQLNTNYVSITYCDTLHSSAHRVIHTHTHKHTTHTHTHTTHTHTHTHTTHHKHTTHTHTHHTDTSITLDNYI